MLTVRASAAAFTMLLAAAAGVTGCSGGEKDSKAESSTPKAPTLTDARADTMVQDVSSGDRERVRAAVAMPEGAPPVPTKTLRSLRGLSDLDLDLKTFQPLTDTTATVHATLDGEPWLVYLVLIDQEWKISVTQRLPQ